MNKRWFGRIILLLGILIPTLTATAQIRWQPLNGPNGYCEFTLFGTDSTGKVWGGTATSLYCSSDNGKTWQVVQPDIRPLGFTVDAHGQAYVFSFRDNKLYTLDEKGRTTTWSNTPRFREQHVPLYVTPQGTLLAAARLHLGSYHSLYVAPDTARGWKPGQKILAPPFFFQFIDGNLVGNDCHAVYGLDADTVTWSVSLEETITSNIVPDGRGGHLMGTETGVLRSTDGCKSWELFLDSLLSVTSFRVSGTRLFAAGPDGIYRSDDGGIIWEHILFSKLQEPEMVVTGDGTLIVSSGTQVFRSTDDGASWEDAVQGIRPGGFGVHVTGQGTIIFGPGPWDATDPGVFTSTDGGENWERWRDTIEWYTGSRTDSLYVEYGFDIRPSADGTIHLATNLGHYASADGLEWERRSENILPLGTVVPGIGVRMAGASGKLSWSYERVLGDTLFFGASHISRWQPVHSDKSRFIDLIYHPGSQHYIGILQNPSTQRYSLHSAVNAVDLPFSDLYYDSAKILHSIHNGPWYNALYMIQSSKNSSEAIPGIAVSYDGGQYWSPFAQGIDSPAKTATMLPLGSRFFLSWDSALYMRDKLDSVWHRIPVDGLQIIPNALRAMPDGRILAATTGAGLYISSQPLVSHVSSEGDDQPNLKISPSPVHDRCRLSLPRLVSGSVRVVILDVLGRVERTWTFPSVAGKDLHLDLTDIAPGIHFVEVRTGNESVGKSILNKH